VPSDSEDFACHDNYAVFAVSVFQFITLAVVFSKGKPYRKPIYTNHSFLLSLIVMTIFTVYLVLWPHHWFVEAFEFDLTNVDMNFRYIIVGLAAINFILAFFAESFVVDYLIFIKLKEWLKTKTSKETPYDKIFNETRSTNWLPSADSFVNTICSVEVEADPKHGKQIAAFQQKNGFVHFSGIPANSCPSVVQKETEISPATTSSPDTGISVSTPLSPASPSSANGQQDTVYGSVSFISYQPADQENNTSKAAHHQPTNYSSPCKSCNDSDFYLSSSRL
jgi:hypothetical protein